MQVRPSCFALFSNWSHLAPLRKCVLLAGAVALGSLAQAQVLIDVKIRTASGADGVFQAENAAVLGTNADFWNGFGYTLGTPYNAALVDSLETATGVTLTVNHTNGVGGYDNGGLISLNATNKLSLAAYQNATTPLPYFTITLNGLNPLTDYRFVGYSTMLGAGGDWAVTTGTLLGGTTSASGANTSMTLGVGYADFNVRTDATGKLVITDTAQSGKYNVIQGFQIQASAIPEPSTYALFFGLATSGLVAFRRWRRA